MTVITALGLLGKCALIIALVAVIVCAVADWYYPRRERKRG